MAVRYILPKRWIQYDRYAVFNALGRRMKDLPITRDKILGALA